MTHKKGEKKFIYTRNGTEMTLRKNAKVAYTSARPTHNVTNATASFAGYAPWANSRRSTGA